MGRHTGPRMRTHFAGRAESMRSPPPIRDDTLLTLQQACDYGFAGGASPATLKHEWSLGNLELSKIGRSYFTTPAKLKAMEAKCLAEPPARNSGSIRNEEPGQSSTVEAVAARDSLMMKLDRLKKPSGNTSRRNTSFGTVQPLSSRTFSTPTQANTSRIK